MASVCRKSRFQLQRELQQSQRRRDNNLITLAHTRPSLWQWATCTPRVYLGSRRPWQCSSNAPRNDKKSFFDCLRSAAAAAAAAGDVQESVKARGKRPIEEEPCIPARENPGTAFAKCCVCHEEPPTAKRVHALPTTSHPNHNAALELVKLNTRSSPPESGGTRDAIRTMTACVPASPKTHKHIRVHTHTEAHACRWRRMRAKRGGEARGTHQFKSLLRWRPADCLTDGRHEVGVELTLQLAELEVWPAHARGWWARRHRWLPRSSHRSVRGSRDNWRRWGRGAVGRGGVGGGRLWSVTRWLR